MNFLPQDTKSAITRFFNKKNQQNVTESKKILITAGRSPITLDLARQLQDAGHTVYIAETFRLHVCNFSKSIYKSFIIPSPRFAPKEFISSLVDIVTKEKIDLLIPSCEEIICLSKGLDRFPPSCQVFCSPFEVIHDLHNKWQFNCKLENYGLTPPESRLIKNQNDLNNIDFDFPYILKPVYSRASQKIIKVVPPFQPPPIEIEPHNPWLAQQWIDGKKYCSYSVCQNGEIKAFSLYPVEYAIDGNSCVSFEAIEHPEIYEWVKNFIREDNFTGQIAFDFIQTDSGKLYSIECNPRATSGIHLFSHEDQLGNAFFNTTEKPIIAKTGTRKQLAIGMLLYGWRTPPFNKGRSNFLSELFSASDVIFKLRDLKPFIFTPLLFLKYFFMSKKLRIRVPSTFTFDLEWNGEDSLNEISSNADKDALIEDPAGTDQIAVHGISD